MRKVLFGIMIILVSIVFTGCLDSPVPPSKQIKSTKIGVVAITSGNMDMDYIGFTAFNNEFNTINIQNWDLASYLKLNTEKILKEKSNMTIIDLKYNINLLRKKSIDSHILNETCCYNPDKIKHELSQLVKQYNLDYILIVTPSKLNIVHVEKYYYIIKYDLAYVYKLYSGSTLEKITSSGSYTHYDLVPSTIWDTDEYISDKNIQGFRDFSKGIILNGIEKPLLKMGLILE